MTPAEYAALAFGALLASTVSGVAGVGGGMVYLPILTEIVGYRLAVPYLTLLLLAGNFSRAWFARKAVNWQVLRHLWIGVLPGAALGALFFTVLSPFWISKLLGLYLLTYVALSFTRLNWPKQASLRSMTIMGLPAGFTSGIVGGSGLIMAPYFLRFGLVKDAFLGTEALGAASTHVIKTIVWGQTSLIGTKDVILLLPLAALMVVGTYLGKILVNKMRVTVFRAILMVMLTIVGVRFLFF